MNNKQRTIIPRPQFSISAPDREGPQRSMRQIKKRSEKKSTDFTNHPDPVQLDKNLLKGWHSWLR